MAVDQVQIQPVNLGLVSDIECKNNCVYLKARVSKVEIKHGLQMAKISITIQFGTQKIHERKERNKDMSIENVSLPYNDVSLRIMGY